MRNQLPIHDPILFSCEELEAEAKNDGAPEPIITRSFSWEKKENLHMMMKKQEEKP